MSYENDFLKDNGRSVVHVHSPTGAMTFQSFENDFLKDNKEHGRSIISIGTPESGKSYLAMKYCEYALKNNIYDSYHIVAPTLDHEENASYDFLKPHKNKVQLYKKYHEVVSNRVDKAREKEKVLFIIDDATAELMNNLDNVFIKLFTTTRHSKNGGLTMWIIVHSAKKVIPPMLRQNVKYVFLYRIESSELLEDTIYKEFLSLKYRKEGRKYDDFVREFVDVMENNEYGVVLVARKIGTDWNVTNWNFLNSKSAKETKTATIQQKPQEAQRQAKPQVTRNTEQTNEPFNPFKKIFFLKNI